MMAQEMQNQERIRLTDLRLKQRFEGMVVRVELYGAFIDFGAEKDGLVHISQLRPERVNRVNDVVNEGDPVTVWVQECDPEQGRVSLTMIEPPEHAIDELEPDMIVTGTVTRLTPYGAFVNIGVERDGLIHISEMAEGRIGQPSDVVKEGQEIQVRVVKVNHRKRQIELSLKGIGEPKVEVQEAGEENEAEPMTSMELAWRQAMEQQGHSLPVSTRKSGGRRQKDRTRREQAAIIARTLDARQD
ncbi:MAG: S1 RNA-binding domain-containing protein [Anaerolineae bacterium]|nr:S1 RNA-binding domain-containing protein [Anaerolineae bacterium]